jgi:hypothetical protein
MLIGNQHSSETSMAGKNKTLGVGSTRQLSESPSPTGVPQLAICVYARAALTLPPPFSGLRHNRL